MLLHTSDWPNTFCFSVKYIAYEGKTIWQACREMLTQQPNTCIINVLPGEITQQVFIPYGIRDERSSRQKHGHSSSVNLRGIPRELQSHLICVVHMN